MSLLKEIVKDLKETTAAGAVGAHAVAAVPGSLFAGGVVSRQGSKRAFSNVQKLTDREMKQTIKNRNKMKWRVIGEMAGEQQFNASDVMSKLTAAEKKAKTDHDTVAFGMEDEDGNIVKVHVRAEQADEFETALGSMLAGEDQDEDGISDKVEIAEVLFQMKDKFDIIDVEWPEIEGDVEEEQEVGVDDEDVDIGADEVDVEGTEELDVEGADEVDVEGGEGEDLEGGEPGGDVEMEPAGGAESALQDVIDMMKADAEARKAESEARAAEAQARAAEAHASAAAAKVKQEEEVLDMETYNKRKKEEEEETERLAKLAKFQHQKASDAETKIAAENEEEPERDHFRNHPAGDGKEDGHTISKDELMKKILHYLQAYG